MTKKSIYCLLGAFFIFCSVAQAQFNKGDKLLNLGLGINSYYGGGIPLSGSFEVGITDEVSVGAGFDYLGYRYSYPGGKWSYSIMYFGGRGSFHLSELLELGVKEMDLYAGASLGFRAFTWREDYQFGTVGFPARYSNGLFLGVFVGARYYFAQKVGVFGEFGAGGSSNAKLGLAFRF
jgi:hypothetical protein